MNRWIEWWLRRKEDTVPSAFSAESGHPLSVIGSSYDQAFRIEEKRCSTILQFHLVLLASNLISTTLLR